MTTPTMIKGRTKLTAHIQHCSWKESLVLQVSLGRELPQLLVEELVHSKLFLGSKILVVVPFQLLQEKTWACRARLQTVSQNTKTLFKQQLGYHSLGLFSPGQSKK